MSIVLDDRFAAIFTDVGMNGGCTATGGLALAGLADVGFAPGEPAGRGADLPAGGVGRFLRGSGWFGGTDTAVC